MDYATQASLQALKIPASGITCVIVNLPNDNRIIWGTADVTWGAAIHNADDEFVAGIETDCPSDTEDIATIVLVLKEASLANGALQQKN